MRYNNITTECKTILNFNFTQRDITLISKAAEKNNQHIVISTLLGNACTKLKDFKIKMIVYNKNSRLKLGLITNLTIPH